MTGKARSLTIVFSFIAAALLHGCIAGKQFPTTVSAYPSELKGTYTLMRYGCHYPESIKNAAFLIPEGSKYRFEIYDLDTSYKTDKGVPADQALAMADSFLRCTSHKVQQTQLQRITDNAGQTIGYELRPLYFPLEFGVLDVMRINYSIQDNTVRAYIKLDPDVEKAIESSGSDNRGSDR